ncbi:hypothetical protein CF15_06745 [Pyrodictium occultum]|uniref:3-dehydroquinate synthase n=1 Tax=Pyrodictium occultum TaxID=2309 RepID=A0A0V8RWL4_PYROC|nr:3-dehydroquinate synthase [Pyrodictium occultum]KSW12419.1 hypothetical protein CF15_06745 [Pyrodictium occultum]
MSLERSRWRVEDSIEVEIVVGPGARRELGRLAREAGPYSAAALVADGGAPRGPLRDLAEALRAAGLPVYEKTLPGGEGVKNLETLVGLWGWMAGHGLPRDTLLVAYGGGAVSDTAGFAAATYMRGIDWATVPTTLLSMADAAVGGKTAVNLSAKNIVGAFHHPRIVLADVELAETLPREDYVSGLAEVVKHALLEGREFLDWLRRSAGRLLERDLAVLTEAVRRSLDAKMRIVARDYRERKGDRMLLNLGHTVAHALEKATGYTMRHGHAVAVGLVVEGIAASLKLGLPRETVEEVRELLASLGLPIAPPRELDPRSALEAVKLDKKRRGGRILVPMLRAVGDPVIVEMELGEALSLLEEAWRIAAGAGGE